MIDQKKYYLWGLFPPEETEYLSFIKDKVQNKLISPCFDVHITLAGPYLNIDKTFVFKLKTFAQNNNSIKLHVDGYCFKQEMFKSFYISIKNTQHLKELRQNICKFSEFHLDINYSPHISLSYGNHSKDEKKELISKLPKYNKPIRISKIGLVEIGFDVNLWKIHESFDLN